MVLTGADIFAEVLVEQGVETLFGYPGGAVLNLYDALYKYSGKIRHIMTAHEQGAAHAADGYARATGKTGVVLATSGPGATNLVTGIATAYMDSIPMVAITGNVGTSLIVRTVKGVKRPALATPMPGAKQNFLLLDCGANVECRPEMLNAFGTMGSVYAEKVMGRETPKVALVNNGAEDTKGTPTYREAHKLLKANPCIHFAGNIEPRYIMDGDVDVVVCDGFVGNVVLKLTEGVAKTLLGMLKKIFLQNLITKLSYLGIKGGLGELKRRVDSGEMKAAFALYPVSMQQLINIADTGNIMPPKTTWFEPKLRSGVVIHSFEE